MQLKNLLPGGFSEDFFFSQILKHYLSNHKHIYNNNVHLSCAHQHPDYMTNILLTITQSCLGAYLYSAGAQHRNLLKLPVMTSMAICHQNIKAVSYTHLTLPTSVAV